MKNKIIKIGFACVFLAYTQVVSAMEPGFYFGFQVGTSNTNASTATIETGGVPDVVSLKADSKGFGERLYFGYLFSKYAGWEAGYTHYGAATYKLTTPNTLANDPAVREGGLDILAKGVFPFQQFSVFGKAGFALMRSSSSGSIITGQSSNTKTSFRPMVAIGVAFDITQNWQADLTASQVFSGGGIQNANLLALGISYHLVDYYCGQFLC